jgi:hypothetical protein
MDMRTEESWNVFWDMVRLFKEDGPTFEAKVRSMDRSDLVELYRMYQAAVADLKGDDFVPYWGEHSEDYIDGTAYDIVAQGESFYMKVMAEPELVRDYVEANPGDDARGLIIEVYEERFGEPFWKGLKSNERSR